MKIGIFDSGIGGISVLNEAFHCLPEEEYIFYADVDHVPYGLKSPNEIKGYADTIVQRLIDMGVDAVLIACNTATAVAAEHLRQKFDITIIGMEPAVKPAVQAAKDENERILVMATPVTIRENKLHALLERVDIEHRVDLLPMPSLVRFAEDGIFEGEEVDTYIDEQTAVFDKSRYTEVVLGCTHFNYFSPSIRKAFNNKVTLIDGNKGTIRHLAEKLGLEEKYGFRKDIDIEELNKMSSFIESGRPIEGYNLKKYLGLHERLEHTLQDR